MTGINLNSTQSVDNLASALKKIGGGNYDKGLEITKKLFTNNGAGSIDQQASKLQDVISKGGKLGDAFTKVQGTFGNKGLFSIKIPPATTEKILNTVAKVANKAAQHTDTIKHAGKAIKQAVTNSDSDSFFRSGIENAAVLAALGITYMAVGKAQDYLKKRKATDSRYATLQGLESKLKPVEVKPEQIDTSKEEIPAALSKVTGRQKQEPMTSKEEIPSTELTKSSNTFDLNPNITTTDKKKDPSSITAISPDNFKKPTVHTTSKPEEKEKKSGITAISPKDNKPVKTITPDTRERSTTVIKPSDNIPNKTHTPSDKKIVSPKAKIELPYGEPTRYKSSIMKPLIKPKESITIPGEKDDKGKWIRRDTIIQVAPELKNYYEGELNKKTSRLVKSLDKFKKKVQDSVKQFSIIVDLKNENTEDKFITALNKIKISKALNEQFIVESIKEQLLEDLYTPSLGMFVPYPKGRMVDMDDLERELRNNTPADNQDYTDDNSVYTSRIDGERLTKIDQIIKQIGKSGVDLYNKYAEDNNCEPYNGKAKVFNPITVSDEDDTYTDGNGNQQPVEKPDVVIFESDKPNFAPTAQGFLQTLNDIYSKCIPKTGLRPFVEHVLNSKLDTSKQEHKLVEAFLKHKIEKGKPKYKEVLQKVLKVIQAKYKK